MTPAGVLAFGGILLACIGIHELGHFVAAKLCGIRVDEFAIGFGPRILSWGKGETRYSIRVLPLGGFVRMAGMLGLPGEGDAGPRNFYRARIWKRLLVMLAGIGANFVLAIAAYTVAFALPTPMQVEHPGPAATAGVPDGARLVSIGGFAVDHSSATTVSTTVHDAVNSSAGHALAVIYTVGDGPAQTRLVQPQLAITNFNLDNPDCDASKLPQGQSIVTAINGKAVGEGTPEALLTPGVHVSGESVGPSDFSKCDRFTFTDVVMPARGNTVVVAWRIGVQLDRPGDPLLTSAGQAALQVVHFIPDEVQALQTVSSTPGSGGVFGSNGLQGPVGIAEQAGQKAQQGPQAVLAFVAFISVNLGYLNLVPVPFLDGGKILLVLIEMVRRKRMAPEREAMIYAAGLVIVLAFLIYVTIGDLRSHH